MESSKIEQKKFLKQALIITTLPQILLFVMMVFKPLSVVFETDNLKITGLLFVIYYVVFSVIIGIKSKKYINRIITAIAQFILLNFYQAILFLIVMELYVDFFSSQDDDIGLSVIILAYFALLIISVLTFSITCIFTNFTLKKKKGETQEIDVGSIT